MTNAISINDYERNGELTATVSLGDETAEGAVEGPEIDGNDLYEIARENGLTEDPFLEDKRFSGITVHPEDQRDLERVSIPGAEANSLDVILAGNGNLDAHFTDGNYEKVNTSTYGRDKFGTLNFSGSEIGHLDISETVIGELDLTNTSLGWSHDSNARDAYVETMRTGNESGQETYVERARWDLRGVEIDEWVGNLPATTEEECQIIVDEEGVLPGSFDAAVEDQDLEATRTVYEGNDGYGRSTCVEYRLPRGLNIGFYEE